MRACRLGAVDPPNSVARLLLEPFDRAVAAAILADNVSSCLLLPLVAPVAAADPGSASHPSPAPRRSSPVGFKRLKAPGFSDACFLRAQLRHGQSAYHHCFFLVASPPSGTTGSCTDLRAWCCDTIGSTRQVALETSSPSCSSPMVGRLDIPHVSVTIVASVNFVAVHSPLASKVWLFAAKFHPDPRAAAAGAAGSLSLVSCAVLDFGATPVYSIHLSMQHLVVGELGQLRVFPLRPLVKGRKWLARHKLDDDDKLTLARVNGLYEKCLVNSTESAAVVVKKKNGFRHHSQDDDEHAGKCNDKDCDHQRANEHRNGVICMPKHYDEVAVQALKEAQQPVDVPLNGMEQVVKIHTLSSAAFVALDSSGRIQIVSLKKSKAHKPRPSSKGASAAVQVDVRPVGVPFRVSCLAVVPSAADARGGIRTLWLSDGKSSVYVLSVPEEVDGPAPNTEVTQVLFMGTGIDSLVALSPETVLALSEGALVAYVKGAS